MKFLITGGAGFIGSHLVERLLNKGHLVDVVDDLSTGALKSIQAFKANQKFRFFHSPAENEGIMRPLIENADIVFHLAASVGVKNVVDNPIRCIENNIGATALCLRLANEFEKRIFTFSTSEIYGKSTKFPFHEDDDAVLGAYNKLRWGYATSKLVDDFLARAYFQEHGTKVTIVRLFNTIGSGQVGSYGMVVPRFFQQALKGVDLTVYGTGKQTRCFSDVRDVVTCLELLIDNQESYGELVNIGSQEEISILALANKIIKLCNSRSQPKSMSFESAYGANFEDMERRVPSVEKLHKLTNYKFQHNLDSTLDWIYKSNTTPEAVISHDFKRGDLDLL